MTLQELIQPSDVIPDLRVKDKRRALQALADHAARALGLDRTALAAALLARETLGSTGMGAGTAIPHARLPAVERPFGLFARLHAPVRFDAIDGRPVDLLCLLILPSARDGEGAALTALACAARGLRDAELLERIRRAPSSALAIHQALAQAP